MASRGVRRPLPALIALVALLLLTALVWWRVLHRNDHHKTASSCSSGSTTPPAKALPRPSSVRLSVLNGTANLKKPRSGIAGKTRTALLRDGFDIPAQAADDKAKVTTVAEIRYGPQSAQSAKLLKYYVPGATLVRTKVKTTTVTLSLGRHFTQVATQATVRRALGRDHLSISSSPPTTAASSASASC